MISKEEIEKKITDIDKQMEIATKSQSYSVSSVSTLIQMREYWLKKLEEAEILETETQTFRFVRIRGWER